jgi:general nucleoside transport system permease protein
MISLSVEKRTNNSAVQTFVILVVSVLAGLFLGSLFFLIKGISPFLALQKIIIGSFGSPYGLKETITKAIPLILIASGLSIAFHGKFWNIGAEGQLLFGAIGATWVALFLGPRLSSFWVFPLMFLAGFIFGAAFGTIPAIFKTKLRINETIVTLMLNYIAAELVRFLVFGPWKGKSQYGFPYTDNFPPNAVLPLIQGSRIHYLTLILSILVVAVSWFILYKTKFGYEVKVMGENPEAGRYAGINFTKTTIWIMILSGGFAGLAGVGEVAGIHHHLSYPDSISSGYGFTAIIVTWLARLNPFFVILSSLFFGGILVGGDAIQTSLGFPAATINIFNGLILFSLIAGGFFLDYKLRLVKRNAR